MKKIGIIIGLSVFIGLSIWLWWRYYFPFSEGIKAGDLNYIEKKGYIFKTWEGRIVQNGLRANPNGGMGSIEFRFSVTDEAVARALERRGGKFVEVRYKEYLHPVSWRGASPYIVTEILDDKAR